MARMSSQRRGRLRNRILAQTHGSPSPGGTVTTNGTEILPTSCRLLLFMVFEKACQVAGLASDTLFGAGCGIRLQIRRLVGARMPNKRGRRSIRKHPKAAASSNETPWRNSLHSSRWRLTAATLAGGFIQPIALASEAHSFI